VSLEANKEVVRRFVVEVVDEGKLELLDEVISPDYLEHTFDPGQAPGREGLRQALVVLRRAFPDFRSTIEEIVAEGEKVAYVAVSRATHQGEFHGIAATGRPIEIEEMHVVRIVDGKIAEHRALYDTFGMMRQLGALPDPAQHPG
jgi:steroid delta-isomerase-like uncharacterized protein